MVGDAITVVSTLVAGMLLARLMTPADMGTYRQVIYLGQLAASLAEMGLSASIYRFWNALDEASRRVYARMLLVSTLVLGLAAAGVLAAIASHVAVWYKNPGLELALLIAAPFPLASVPIQFLRPVLISQGASLKATALETFFALVAVVSVAVPVALGAPLPTALLFWIVGCLARVLLVPLLLRTYLFVGGPWWHTGLAKEVWEYLWPIQLSRLPGLLTTYLDQILMSVYLSPRAFAVYSMGARELPLVGMVGPSLSSVLLPHLVQDVAAARTEQICRRWRKASLTTAMLTYPVAAFAILNATSFMQFMFSVTYRESAIPFRIFAAITFLRVVEYASLAKAFNRTEVILKATLFSAVVQVALAFLLTWLFGVLGMASAVFLGYVAGAAWFLRANGRVLRRPLSEFFPWRLLLLLCATAFLAAQASKMGLAVVLPPAIESGMLALGVRLTASFGTGVVLYGTALIGLGTILPELSVPALLHRKGDEVAG